MPANCKGALHVTITYLVFNNEKNSKINIFWKKALHKTYLKTVFTYIMLTIV